ncbi:peptidyl-prolyl cis-trans isomerase CYP21-4-like [Rhododendron vialii]|uniref:peptidyl-prolyl cis-trans isomerase CYP21-4-like n=1 Tax=Rhododendron vialii TaxID=182163 RepID=UPI00265DEDDC|nr:peptidyl-prolyl cis-trans isomerase CYP21-4-like [Rhododendron vialii]XP_058197948.1 peptidyl-prolyl cis-trans isomerase CYP21-4-like [Rhododendron vialii]XP_058197949.1 peptidyl-prolyl cis-trans isomerase CYP21-4-like [Rhododendron vialii]XP_058197950.1 peptidyl-prolyl cis-trans isomerase CYP21-4-like [Rhododendron vialii]
MVRIKPQALLQQSKKKKGPSRISVTTVVLYILIIAVLFFVFATYRHWTQRSKILTMDPSSVLESEDDFADERNSGVARYAILSTTKGSITVELYKEGSAGVVDEFINLCQRGYFKEMPFRHIVKNFVIQGSSFDGPGSTENWTLRGKLNSRHDTSMKRETFVLGTSKAKHDEEGWELFITTAPIPADLSEKLIVFGRVIRGEDIVQEIEEVDTDEHYQPKSPIGITNVTLKQKV